MNKKGSLRGTLESLLYDFNLFALTRGQEIDVQISEKHKSVVEKKKKKKKKRVFERDHRSFPLVHERNHRQSPSASNF